MVYGVLIRMIINVPVSIGSVIAVRYILALYMIIEVLLYTVDVIFCCCWKFCTYIYHSNRLGLICRAGAYCYGRP